jgi:hypothetical protein
MRGIMNAAINYLQRDSSTLKGTVDLNRSEMDKGGFTEETYTNFSGNIADLNLKETVQEKAVKDTENKSALLSGVITKAQSLISDIKAAAKSAYGSDPRNLNMFNIGADIPKSVKNLIPLCNYMCELAEERKVDLLKNGFKQEKIDALKAMPVELTAADDNQEAAKKIQKTRTMERDKAANILKVNAAKIRNFAKACFSDRPEILLQFDPITKGRGGEGGDEEDKNTPQTPTTPAS